MKRFSTLAILLAMVAFLIGCQPAQSQGAETASCQAACSIDGSCAVGGLSSTCQEGV